MTRPPASALRFFLWVFALSAPFWAAGALVGQIPDVPINLPISALMTVVPMVAALILVYRESGAAGAKDLLKRIADYRRVTGAKWVAAAICLMPGALLLAYGVQRVSGALLPDPQIPLGTIPVFFAVFFVAAIGEELGWQGYAYDRLRARWNALETGFILGLIWALWHAIPYLQTGQGAWWIVWHSMVTVVLRVITVWLYVNAGHSVFIAVLFHAMCNVGYFLFPNYGSHYDPFVAFWILLLATGAIVLLWGPRTLAQFRYGRDRRYS